MSEGPLHTHSMQVLESSRGGRGARLGPSTYTALTFRRTSAEWAMRTETTLSGQRMLADVIPLAGGVPIKVGEDTIGGVGLSGAPMGGEQEEACAKAGIAKVSDQLR
jgi:uncharacterized protein GlcG (DUF336 family)